MAIGGFNGSDPSPTLAQFEKWVAEGQISYFIAGGGFGGGPGAGTFRRPGAASHTVAVHLSAAVSANVILLAVVLAVAGGIIAGIFGGWRAARLRPAAALAKVA